MRQHDKGLPSCFDEIVRPNRLALQALGLWPDDRSDLYCMAVPQVYSVKLHWGNVAHLAETGSPVMPFMLLLVIYMAIHDRGFIVVYKRAKQFWQITDDPKERVNYEILARIGGVVIINVILVCVANVVTIIGTTVIVELKNQYRINETRHRRPLPVDLAYGFNHEKSQVPECLFVGQSISFAIGAIFDVAGDGSALVVLLHIIGHFKFVNLRLCMIGRQFVKLDIFRCIEHHRYVVSVADWVSDLTFDQLITSGLQICISCYAVIEGGAVGIALIRCLDLFAALIDQPMTWCLPGDILGEESGAVATSGFHGLPWSFLPVSSLGDLLLIILRAQNTCKVMAFCQVTDIPKLTEIITAAVSYITLLRRFKR